MKKSVAILDRYRRVSLSANAKYIDALAVVNDPAIPTRELDRLTEPVRIGGRSIRGFNPVAKADVSLFHAVFRGEHLFNGFRNRNVREFLLGPSENDAAESRRRSARVSRYLKRLHVHGLIAKIPRSRRWRITHKGTRVMAAAINLRDMYFIPNLRAAS